MRGGRENQFGPEQGQPQLVIFPRNSQVNALAQRLEALGVPLQKVDGQWMLDQGAELEPALEAVRGVAGELGKVTIANEVSRSSLST